jgi:hypothetical protein
MDDLPYKTFRAPKRPFVKGDWVAVKDREGKLLSTQRVVRAGPRVVRTECGRRWTQRGWYLGETRARPFPTIHLQTI